MVDFAPGQYLSIRIRRDIKVDGFSGGHDLVRNYSLSEAPGKGHLRISVKREDGGLVSNHLHREIREGSVIEVGIPCGCFTLDPKAEKVVLLSAGVGVTPIMAMLERALHNEGTKHITVVQSVKSPEMHPMKKHVDELAAQNGNRLKAAVCYTQVGAYAYVL